jgi:hypothetical protein
MPPERTTKMAHTDPHAALLEHVAKPAFYGAQPSSVRLLVQTMRLACTLVLLGYLDLRSARL